jgi:uracil-DNA glycosylase
MNWKEIIKQEQKKEYFKELKSFVDTQYEQTIVYPPKKKIFNAFSLCKYENLKVVILGQDPYHNPNQAQGLAFSTPKDIKNPPSMVNILKEIHSDVGSSKCDGGDLTSWAQQGVLLINTVLTVEENKPHSHKNKGWEIFTDSIIKYISQHKKGIVFLLWGTPAIKKTKLIDENNHHILSAPHPSPLSAYRGFFGCRHFSQTNSLLQQMGKSEIVW